MGRASLQARLSERDARNRSEGAHPTASHAKETSHSGDSRKRAAWDRRGASIIRTQSQNSARNSARGRARLEAVPHPTA